MNVLSHSVLAACLALAAGSANAQERTPDTQRLTPDTVAGAVLDALTRDVAAELRCPVCQGESIQESPSELALEMKALVRDQLAAGKTPDEVKAYFVARYGEWILLRPTTSGFNKVLYWLPPVVLLAGLAGTFLLARRWVRANAAAHAQPTPSDHAS